MTKELAKRTQQVLELPNAILSKTGLTIAPGTTEEGLTELSKKLTQIGAGFQWWMGDLVSYAMHNFKDPESFIATLQEETGWGRAYLLKLHHVSRLFPHRERFATLSHAHHCQVSHIRSRGKRIGLLKKAEARGWSLSKLEFAAPKVLRTVRVIFRVPPSLAKDAAFVRFCKRMCEEFEITYYVAGSKRQGKPRGPARRPMIAEPKH